MKQKVTLDFTKEETGEKFSIDFYSVKKIDKYINTLQAMRAELEHKIEMEKQRKAQERNKREPVKPKVFFAASIKDALNGNFIELDDILKSSEKHNNFAEISVEEEAKNYKAFVDAYNELPLAMKMLLSPIFKKIKNVHNEFVNSHKK